MILQALYDYAQRKGDELPEDGFEDVEIKYLIKIREDGSLVDLVSTIEDKKGHVYSKVPMRVARTSSPKASLLLDNAEYVLGIPKQIKETEQNYEAKQKKANEKALICNELFVKEIEGLPNEILNEKEIKAVIAFYRSNRQNGFDKISACEKWEECQKTTGNISFVLNGEMSIIPQLESIRKYQRKITAAKSESDDENSEIVKGVCLITGEESVIARLHSATSIRNSQATAPLVGFNKDSFLSYGKKQSYNAPVSIKAEAGYTKALNYLIHSKDNKFLLGEDTIVFWAEKRDAETFESSFSAFFTTDFDAPDRNVREVKNLFAAVQTGKLESIDSNFYVLCLSPNSGRISVRFWETGKVETFAKRIKQHFDDFEIIKPAFDEKEYLNLYQILSSTALEHKMENVAPNLIGSVMQSILKKLPYPATLQQQCIRRIRAEQSVTRERAAILKAYITRLNRQKNIKEVSVALDRNNTNKGYLLGRLFAAFEKVQQESADTELNSTITDRFYGAASTNPVTVFTQLMRLNRNHMSKLKSKNRGLQINRDKEIGEIMNAIDSFPAHLDLNEQSYFAIGYYHEKQSFFDKQSKSENSEGEK
ncbi:type I-C CRISPR-associated protein Cas8c/Csd1 [Treponema saccharophilum]|uniref:CRISPR-associated protein, Csd1 family n=1 Tax=Treponema saccharophilum DSM 2985 TaxID=907348 RepID=H7EJ30_9SPIR|nr:type I-C CRISPR-associated protein Cas8c/Csd1 [Treponema saccharophilum]EIC02344.1 CRISPR-associated protein, Csd1 family [Treponema saccharophilum DSM 2985]BDC97704.1 type I-C CRISPR-associated protein Cas8c/Csd1 [Treponema saccharophilum]